MYHEVGSVIIVLVRIAQELYPLKSNLVFCSVQSRNHTTVKQKGVRSWFFTHQICYVCVDSEYCYYCYNDYNVSYESNICILDEIHSISFCDFNLFV